MNYHQSRYTIPIPHTTYSSSSSSSLLFLRSISKRNFFYFYFQRPWNWCSARFFFSFFFLWSRTLTHIEILFLLFWNDENEVTRKQHLLHMRKSKMLKNDNKIESARIASHRIPSAKESKIQEKINAIIKNKKVNIFFDRINDRS